MKARALALLLTSCAFEAPAVGSIACEMNMQPGVTYAPVDACKLVRTESGMFSLDRDVCETGVRCLVLPPGGRAFKWHRVGAPPADIYQEVDVTCSVTCEEP